MSACGAITAENLNRNMICDGNDNQMGSLPVRRASSHGRLRRLPHVFCKVLDLPFPADTRVVMEERKDSYMYFIAQPGLVEADVVAEAVEIVPGSIKVTLRGADRIRAAVAKHSSTEMESWRARLPPSTIPEAAKATYARGTVAITIPKVLPAAKGPPPKPAARSCSCASQEMKRSLLCLV